MTNYQIGKLRHCFGLDYSRTPWRNYYGCSEVNAEWEDMISKGYAVRIENHNESGIFYAGTLKGLQLVFRKNVSLEYFNSKQKREWAI
jgi:hypothetical protein